MIHYSDYNDAAVKAAPLGAFLGGLAVGCCIRFAVKCIYEKVKCNFTPASLNNVYVSCKNLDDKTLATDSFSQRFKELQLDTARDALVITACSATIAFVVTAGAVSLFAASFPIFIQAAFVIGGVVAPLLMHGGNPRTIRVGLSSSEASSLTKTYDRCRTITSSAREECRAKEGDSPTAGKKIHDGYYASAVDAGDGVSAVRMSNNRQADWMCKNEPGNKVPLYKGYPTILGVSKFSLGSIKIAKSFKEMVETFKEAQKIEFDIFIDDTARKEYQFETDLKDLMHGMEFEDFKKCVIDYLNQETDPNNPFFAFRKFFSG